MHAEFEDQSPVRNSIHSSPRTQIVTQSAGIPGMRRCMGVSS